ncbi:MAG: S8 family serine peptidase [Anaerolineae bacterium]|nr:S8 family serine peptidase [Anaerolineae bacterium]
MQYEGPIRPAWRAALQTWGATILDYIPDYAYKVSVPADRASELVRLPGVIWSGPFEARFRLSPALGMPQMLADQLHPVRVELEGSAVEATTAFSDRLASLNIQVIGQEGLSLLVEATQAQIEALARDPAVRWISPLRVPRLHNDIATDLVFADPVWTAGLAGDGQIINVADTGLDTGRDSAYITGDIHRDVEGRIAGWRSWPISSLWHRYLDNPVADDGIADLDYGHGTHVAGSAVGSGTRSDGRYRGVAYRAQLTMQALQQYCDWSAAAEAQGFTDGYGLVGVPADLTGLYTEAYGWGSRIHTNSWGFEGQGLNGFYTEECRQTDRFVWDHRDMVILFSAGNDGRDGNGDGRVDAGSIVPPATAKNIIAVGAAESQRADRFTTYGFSYPDAFPANPMRDDPMANAGARGMMALSGRGPTRDGRLAPHVVAPGTWIASLRSSVATSGLGPWGYVDSYYMYLGGTSMSTPLVAGSAALVRQAYEARGHAPSAALVKATLIQTAKDMPGQYAAPYGDAGPIPNNDEGWGVIDVRAATTSTLRFVDETQALQTGQVRTHVFYASGSSRPARFSLVWTDYPAAVEAAVALVNDLDLKVTAPDGQTYLGNVFGSASGIEGVWSVVGGSADRVNNVECVYLPRAQSGAYRVEVRGRNVPMLAQNYALLVDLPQPGAFELNMPLVLRNAVLSTPTPTPTPSSTATPTVTPTATPTVSVTPTPLDEWRDDFSEITGRWLITSTQAYLMDYVEGEYRIQVSPDERQKGSLPAWAHEGDLRLEVDARAANEEPQSYGLIFNLVEKPPNSPYQAFVVSPEGFFGVIRQDGTDIIAPTTSAAIHTGGATNRLSVERVGEQITCAVNGVVVATFAGAEFAQGSRVGLISVCRGAELSDARFDHWRSLAFGGGAGTNTLGGAGPAPRLVR